MKRFWKNYGLKGKSILIRRKAPNDAIHASEPWSYDQQKAIVVDETNCFLTLEIQPHMNPEGFAESKPYCTSVHKHDIATGVYQLKRLNGTVIG